MAVVREVEVREAATREAAAREAARVVVATEAATAVAVATGAAVMEARLVLAVAVAVVVVVRHVGGSPRLNCSHHYMLQHAYHTCHHMPYATIRHTIWRMPCGGYTATAYSHRI